MALPFMSLDNIILFVPIVSLIMVFVIGVVVTLVFGGVRKR
jgi:hypothetical protein